ncbi:hypothetical protein HPP92_009313 [Vanilla planifolia]|uniref:Uncharacterized protein n=1 Tax=Vanilla planifolia TaxID=51239 RepID=A0A835RJ32_VANPL|nr:hypothetical protein HPP92_009313 [Vanilla planifolia]
MKGPGLFSDIGKKARDLLTRDYSYDQKLTISTYSASGVCLTSGAVKKGGLYAFDVSTQYKYKNSLVDVKIDTDSNITTTITVSEILPSTKTITTFKLPEYNTGKLEFQYFHDHAALASVVALKQNPVVDLSAVVGVHGVAFGAEAGFDTSSGSFTKYNAGLGLKKQEYEVSVVLADKGDTLRASYLYHIDEKQASSAVAEITEKFSTNENIFTVGAAYELDPTTTVKARLNNSVLRTFASRGKSCVGPGDFRWSRPRPWARTPKFGLALALKP